MSSIESEMNVVQTRAFIEHDPIYVVIYRTEATDDGAGGTIIEPLSPISAQRVRVSGQARQRVVETPDGRQLQIDVSLIGLPGFDVRLGDLFLLGGYEYEVVNIQDQPAWRIVAESIRRKSSQSIPVTSGFDSGFDTGFN